MAGLYISRRGRVGFSFGWIGLLIHMIGATIKGLFLFTLFVVWLLIGLVALADWGSAKMIPSLKRKRAESRGPTFAAAWRGMPADFQRKLQPKRRR
jgi:hypothetical protein